MDIGAIFSNLFEGSGFANVTDVRQIIMIVLACVLLYLGIAKKFEPLLLVGIAFGMLLSNLPISGVYHPEFWGTQIDPATGELAKISYSTILKEGGLVDLLYIGVKIGLYPSLIFIGVGAMTDFGPMIANAKCMLLGAAAQLGVYVAFALAIALGFNGQEAASIGIIGGADGPTAIWLTKELAPHLLAPIAIAAYSYMALIPLIQPPIMRALTTKKERETKMEQMRSVSKAEKIIFPVAVTIITCLFLPSVAPLLGCLMFGNLLKECGVTDRLSDTAQNALMNIVTLFLGISVGATAFYDSFLTLNTIKIVCLGLLAFAISTAGGVLLGKVMYKVTGGKVNPLIGSAGVSAVPMAARVSQVEGAKANPSNFLLMHAMSANVSGVIGSAVAAGFLMAVFG
ncbi:MAG: sodium ion-translocating decarboxylase subunit beta [Clostridia bacterium]|nr:sodium ion-translocating decarboxylase subunit beta [Clostridia bacterium]